MKQIKTSAMMIAITFVALIGCKKTEKPQMQEKVDEFVMVELSSELVNTLSEKEKQMLPYLFEAAALMDDIFWMQAYGSKETLLGKISDEATKEFALINYGPWERLKNNEPFVEGYGKKPESANFYPIDMTREEFEAFDNPEKTSLYTIISRDETGALVAVPYSVAYSELHLKAAGLILKAAELAEDEGLKKYLELRAEALMTDNYFPSDLAWMEMKTNNIDFVVGPIENYEDRLYGYKAAHESFILLKDNEWSKKLEKYAGLLPELQKRLPVEPAYKTEVPGSESDMGVYDAVFYAGDCNAGSKTIAINLPNDEKVHEMKGSRKLQLKNSMKYKFDKILIPISDILISEDQRENVKFDAFFENVMFHEVGHGLGIKNTINNSGTVRNALKEQYSGIEEAKADIMGLFLVTQLYEMGEFPGKNLLDNYVTFMAGIFRSTRFGAASAHGKANMMTFQYFEEKHAFTRDENTGTYRVDFEKMTEAMNSLANLILTIQGDGNYDAARSLISEKGVVSEQLQKDLDKIAKAGIPRDIRFKQGLDVIGL
jgi:hypothetical protein